MTPATQPRNRLCRYFAELSAARQGETDALEGRPLNRFVSRDEGEQEAYTESWIRTRKLMEDSR